MFSTAEGLACSGMAVGTAVGNAAVVVGNRVIEAPKLTLNGLNDLGRGDLKGFAASIGTTPLAVAQVTLHTARDVGEIAVTQAVRLAKTTLEHARKTAEQGAKLATKVGNFIADKAVALGGEIAKVGPLAAGLGMAVWNEMKKYLNCLKASTSLVQCSLAGSATAMPEATSRSFTTGWKCGASSREPPSSRRASVSRQQGTATEAAAPSPEASIHRHTRCTPTY